MSARRLGVAALLVFATACGGAATHAPPRSVPAPASVPSPPARPLSGALASVAPDADYALRIDGRVLRKSPLFAVLVTALRHLPHSASLAAVDQKCGFSLLGAIDEIVLSGKLAPSGGRPHLEDALVAVELNRAPADGVRCVANIAGDARPATVAGRAAMQTDVDEYVAVAGRLVLAGSRRALAAGFARVENGGQALPAALQSDFARHLDAAVYARARLPAGIPAPARSAELLLRSDASQFLLRLSVEATSERAAARLAQLAGHAQPRLAKMARAASDPEMAAAARDVARAIRITTHGRAATIEFFVAGDARTQVVAVGEAAALAIGALRSYIAQAKSAEARFLLGMITERLIVYLDGLPAAHRRMPPSAPRTPANVPKGTRGVVTSNDWKGTWKLLHFTPNGHPYYSVEIEVSHDRKHAAVRALGDLNGDGVLGTYEQDVDIAPDGSVQVAPALKITHAGD
jgi:hypothetical protein